MMKTEEEIKQMLEDYSQCYNDGSDRYRTFGQRLTYQGMDVLEWVLGYRHKGCPRCGWGPEETIEKYKAAKNSKKRSNHKKKS